jgi:hypothetical protein
MVGYLRMDQPRKPSVDRRSFLTGAATGAAAALLAKQAPAAAQPAAAPAPAVPAPAS